MELKLPEGATPEQRLLVALAVESHGRCVVTQQRCCDETHCGHWGTFIYTYKTRGEEHSEKRTRWYCPWGDYPCYSAITLETPLGPQTYGELLFGIPDEDKPLITQMLETNAQAPAWQHYSDNLRQALIAMIRKHGIKRPLDYQTILKREWSLLHRSAMDARYEAEQRAMHDLGEMPARGPRRFRTVGQGISVAQDIGISQEIEGAKLPGFIIKTYGQGVPGKENEIVISPKPVTTGKWTPVVIAEIPSLSTYNPETQKWIPTTVTVDISTAMKNISKSARNKALRYGKPLPEPAQLEIEKLVAKAVRERLK